jgi:cytochrome c biogenesis protein CcdA
MLKQWIKAAIFASILALILVGSFLNAERILKEASTSLPCPKCPIQPNSNIHVASYPLLFTFGIISGFSPCMIALISFVVATTLQFWKSRGGVLKRVVAIAGGVLYLHLVILFLFISLPTLLVYTDYLITPLAAVLVILGIANFIEVIHDLYTGNWRIGKEATIPLFKTPKPIKELIRKASLRDNLYVDFMVGVMFSLVKLGCSLALLVPSLPILQPLQSLASVAIFSVGVVLPLLLLGLFLYVGLIKASQLYEVRSKSRIVQRTIVGAAFIVSAFLVLQ